MNAAGQTDRRRKEMKGAANWTLFSYVHQSDIYGGVLLWFNIVEAP
jgi:hypothetical protein